MSFRGTPRNLAGPFGVPQGDSSTRPHSSKSTNSGKEVDFVWTSVQHPSIMLAVGSANLTLLAVSFLVGCLCLFQPHLLAGLHLGPFLCSPESKIWAATFSNCRRCTHGKETLLWQS